MDGGHIRGGLGVGHVIGTTFGLLVRNPVLFLAPFLVFVVGFHLAQVHAPTFAPVGISTSSVESAMFYIRLKAILVGILEFFLGVLVSAWVSLVAYRRMTGSSTQPKSAVRRVAGCWLPLLAMSVLYFLMVVVGFLALIFPGLYLAARYAAFSMVILVEGGKPFARASELSEGARPGIIGAHVVLLVLTILPALGVTGLISGLIFWPGPNTVFMLILSELAVDICSYAVFAAFAVALYSRLREREMPMTSDDLTTVFA